nr:hypothetical protein [Arthrospira sp. PLM2.Bin9]
MSKTASFIPPLKKGDRLSKKWIIATALFFLTILTRLPFYTQFPQGDEGHFAMAVLEFDVSKTQPQMPGMFIIFIWMARFFHLFLDDPTLSLVAVNIVASGVTVSALYLLGKSWYNHQVGLSVSLLTLTSPLFWYHSVTAFSHTLEFTWVVLIIAAAYLTSFGNRLALFNLAILMGLAGGIRPSTPFFMLPLALVSLFLGWRFGSPNSGYRFKLTDIFIAVSLGLAAVAVWFIPLIVSSGGWENYWQLIQEWIPLHTERRDADSLAKIFDNFMVFMKAYFRLVGVAIIPMFLMLVCDRQAIAHIIRRDRHIQTLCLSWFPGMLYFLFVHLRRKSQAMTIMPGIMMMAGLTIVWLGDRWQTQKPDFFTTISAAISKPFQKSFILSGWGIVTAAIVCVNGLFFLFGPAGMPTAQDIRVFNRDIGERIEFVRDRFSPETTVVLTRHYYYRLIDLYLSDYQQQGLSRDLGSEAIVLPTHVETLVLLDNRIFTDPTQTPGFQTLEMPSGNQIRYITWSEDFQLQLRDQGAILIKKGL